MLINMFSPTFVPNVVSLASKLIPGRRIKCALCPLCPIICIFNQAQPPQILGLWMSLQVWKWTVKIYRCESAHWGDENTPETLRAAGWNIWANHLQYALVTILMGQN